MSEFIDTSVFFKEQLDRANEMIKALATELENTQETNVRLQQAVDLALAGLKETMAGCKSYDADYAVCERTIKEIKQLIKGE